MFLVSGATGQVGSEVVEGLLRRGAAVRAYVRSEAKGRALADRGVEIAMGTFEDVDALARALDGVDAAFLMQPNDFESQAFVEDGKRRAAGYRTAVERAGGPRIVGLSSVGAHHPSGNGPIDREHAFEQTFAEVPGARFLRAAYFMENWANVLDPVRGGGVLPTFLAADAPIPMVSVADIGDRIAAALMQTEGPRVLELAGPVDHAPDDVAATFAELLGKPIAVAAEPTAGVIPMFTSLGFSPHIAGLVKQMYEGYQRGTMAFEGRPTRGDRSLKATLEALLQR